MLFFLLPSPPVCLPGEGSEGNDKGDSRCTFPTQDLWRKTVEDGMKPSRDDSQQAKTEEAKEEASSSQLGLSWLESRDLESEAQPAPRPFSFIIDTKGLTYKLLRSEHSYSQ